MKANTNSKQVTSVQDETWHAPGGGRGGTEEETTKNSRVVNVECVLLALDILLQLEECSSQRKHCLLSL